MQSVLCNHDKIHQSMRWKQLAHSKVILRDTFLSKANEGEAYHYWKEKFCSSWSSFQCMVLYCWRPKNSLIKSLNSQISYETIFISKYGIIRYCRKYLFRIQGVTWVIMRRCSTHFCEYAVVLQKIMFYMTLQTKNVWCDVCFPWPALYRHVLLEL